MFYSGSMDDDDDDDDKLDREFFIKEQKHGITASETN
jgi:hypothetical protein